MWATLAMMAVLELAPAQPGALTLTNVRPTYGFLGATRKDAANPKLIPGDQMFLSFDIGGLKVGDDGKVEYSMGMEVTNSEGKTLFRNEPQPQKAFNSLGGNRVPAFAAAAVGTDTPPGNYTLTVFVKDLSAKTEKKVAQKFEVLKPQFGIVRLGLSYDDRGQVPAPPHGVPGQRLLVNFYTTGYALDPKTKQPHVSVTMNVLEGGKPVLKAPYKGAVEKVPEGVKLIPNVLYLNLNRPGKFTVELKATDEIAKKTVTQTFDLTVHEIK